MNENNKVYLKGKVASEIQALHQVGNEAFYEFLVETQRLSGVKDVLPVTASERLVKAADIRVGAEICIFGDIRSYNRLEEGYSRLKLTVFVESVLQDVPCKHPNNIELQGYLCKPPVYRTTPFNREIVDLLIAVHRGRKSDYIPCIVWGRNARFAQELKVGDFVKVEGRIQSREYQKKRSETDIRTLTAYEVPCSCIAKEGGQV